MSPITITPSEAAGIAEYESLGIVNLEIAEVMKILRVSRQTVDRAINRRELPAFRIGSSIKIPIIGFKKYIAARVIG